MSSYTVPTKRIGKMFDLNPWFYSKAYTEYLAFLRDLNESIKGMKTSEDLPLPTKIMNLFEMLETFQKWTDEFPPEEMENQRFGNKAYRKWHDKLVQECPSLLEAVLGDELSEAVVELAPYLFDSFGNSSRIDYGSGHEASFMIFLLCLFKCGFYTAKDRAAVVLRIFNKYLKVCRHLQQTYKMEPAGSRGVHALDDFQFLPFLLGSAQLIGNRRLIPDSYTNKDTVDLHSHESLFLEAIKYINETKTGPFHEHSNQLWNISAVPNWGKVNEGMFKMYEAEVLKKFPVVQHILFGSLFSFEKREGAPNEPLTREMATRMPVHQNS